MYFNNLFTNIKLFKHLRKLSFRATNTVRVSSEIFQDLINLKEITGKVLCLRGPYTLSLRSRI